MQYEISELVKICRFASRKLPCIKHHVHFSPFKRHFRLDKWKYTGFPFYTGVFNIGIAIHLTNSGENRIQDFYFWRKSEAWIRIVQFGLWASSLWQRPMILLIWAPVSNTFTVWLGWNWSGKFYLFLLERRQRSLFEQQQGLCCFCSNDHKHHCSIFFSVLHGCLKFRCLLQCCIFLLKAFDFDLKIRKRFIRCGKSHIILG